MESARTHTIYWLAGGFAAAGLFLLARRIFSRPQPACAFDEVEQASFDSFPASDPPAWTGGYHTLH